MDMNMRCFGESIGQSDGQMPGMDMGRVSMNTGPLVMSGESMGVRVGDSEANVMTWDRWDLNILAASLIADAHD